MTSEPQGRNGAIPIYYGRVIRAVSACVAGTPGHDDNYDKRMQILSCREA